MTRAIAILSAILLASGCATQYRTPGGGLSYADFALIEDGDIRDHFEREPASAFPANIAIVRVQDAGYSSLTTEGYGHGRYSIVTTRDIETDEQIQQLSTLPLIAGIAPLGRMLAPSNANTIRDLRMPAARLRADMILIYSVDTSFAVDGKSLGPLSLVSLGFIPNKNARVTATVAGVLVDVRTGYIYGSVEATAREQQSATVWSTETAIESSRLTAEKNAFDDFVGEFQALWSGVANDYVARAGKPAGVVNTSAGQEARQDRYYTIRFDQE